MQIVVAVVLTTVVCILKKRKEDIEIRKKEQKEKRDELKAEQAKIKRDADEKVRAPSHPSAATVRCSFCMHRRDSR